MLTAALAFAKLAWNVTITISVFFDVTLCFMTDRRRHFRGTGCLHYTMYVWLILILQANLQ
jgi:hypothetical protein